MRFDKRYKIHEAAARDVGRYAINGVHRDGTKLVATDGRALAVVPCQPDDDDTNKVTIPTDLVKAATVGRHEATIKLNGQAEAKVKAGLVSAPYEQGEFPNWRAVTRDDSPGDVVIGINAEILLRLAKALGAENTEVFLRFDRDLIAKDKIHGIEHVRGSLIVSPGITVDRGSEAYGVMMPVVIS